MVQGRLEHPAIVPVHEVGRDAEACPYFVMKKLTGTPLTKSSRIPSGMPRQRVLRAFADVCLAVEFAHVRGVVHRDLKPDNIVLGDYGEVYVLDWGVAKILGEDDGDFADIGSGSGEHATRGRAPRSARRATWRPSRCAGAAMSTGAPTSTRSAACCSRSCRRAAASARSRRRWRARSPASMRDRRSARPTRYPARARRAVRCRRPRSIATSDCTRHASSASGSQRYLDGDRDLALAASSRTITSTVHAPRSSRRDEPDNRRTAMREAAGALALDPALAGAAELVGRLMLEPPRETPHEVAEAMAAADAKDARTIAKTGVWVVFGALMFLPLLWWIAPSDSIYLPALLTCLLLNWVVAAHSNRAKTPRPGFVVIANTITVIVLARMYSPIMVAPGIAASLAIAMVLTPRYSILGSPITIAMLMIGAVTVPLVLEQLGVLSVTMSVSSAGILFGGPAISGAEAGPTIAVTAVYAIALIISAVVAGHLIRSRAREAQNHLHLQAWQLRQLVPR